MLNNQASWHNTSITRTFTWLISPFTRIWADILNRNVSKAQSAGKTFLIFIVEQTGALIRRPRLVFLSFTVISLLIVFSLLSRSIKNAFQYKIILFNTSTSHGPEITILCYNFRVFYTHQTCNNMSGECRKLFNTCSTAQITANGIYLVN